MEDQNIIPKGKKYLVEVETTKEIDWAESPILRSVYRVGGEVVFADYFQINIVYTQTIEEIKEGIKNSIIETIDRL